MVLKIHSVNPEPRYITKAAEILRAGGIVIYPTDTVYGIGCSARERKAIERIYLIKRQREDRPFSFICSDLKNISEYAHVSNSAFKIIRRLIPGPYTFVLPATKMRHLPKILVSKRKTVGIRVPDNKITLSLINELGHPILSTSVTTEEGELLNDPELIAQKFRSLVDVIIDAGILTSEPSTVIDLTGERPEIVRKGAGDVTTLE